MSERHPQGRASHLGPRIIAPGSLRETTIDAEWPYSSLKSQGPVVGESFVVGAGLLGLSLVRRPLESCRLAWWHAVSKCLVVPTGSNSWPSSREVNVY